jgi:glycine/D-amino acid oxidase-like deaminating enzyme
VREFRLEGGAVRGVTTGEGELAAPVVVLAAGCWSPVLAERAGTIVAMWPIRHELQITAPIDGVTNAQPVVRVIDAKTYVRPIDGALMFGAYEPDPLQLDMRTQPDDYRIERLPIVAEPLQRRLDEVANHFPDLVRATWQILRGGLPTTTPDGHFLVGPLSDVEGLWLIGGCNVGGLSTSPALG